MLSVGGVCARIGPKNGLSMKSGPTIPFLMPLSKNRSGFVQNGHRIWIQRGKTLENGYSDVFFLVRTPKNGQSEISIMFRMHGGAVGRTSATWQHTVGQRSRWGQCRSRGQARGQRAAHASRTCDARSPRGTRGARRFAASRPTGSNYVA